MCGIAGFVGFRDPARMSGMLKTLAHRSLGGTPFYDAVGGGPLVSAGKIKALQKGGLFPPEAEPDVRQTPCPPPASPRTGLRGIRKLPAAHCLTWRDGATTVRRWW